MLNINSNIWDTNRGLVLVHTTVEIPASSFAKISSYDNTNRYFNVIKPNANSLPAHLVVIVPELIAANKTGIAYLDGIGVITKTAGETIVAGDEIGTDNAQWTCIIGVGFHVITVLTNDIVVRKIAGSIMRIFKIISNATGDGLYNCYEQTIDATYWTATNGTSKITNLNTNSIVVFNLGENGVSTHALSDDDLLIAYRLIDDDNSRRFIGFSPEYSWWHV